MWWCRGRCVCTGDWGAEEGVCGGAEEGVCVLVTGGAEEGVCGGAEEGYICIFYISMLLCHLNRILNILDQNNWFTICQQELSHCSSILSPLPPSLPPIFQQVL